MESFHNYSMINYYGCQRNYGPFPSFYPPGQVLVNADQYLQALIHNLEKEKKERLELQSKLQKEKKENEVLKMENQRLKQQLRRNPYRPKRKYKKRISNIDSKKFECREPTCGKRYSSRIALNAHKRKNHRGELKVEDI